MRGEENYNCVTLEAPTGFLASFQLSSFQSKEGPLSARLGPPHGDVHAAAALFLAAQLVQNPGIAPLWIA